MSTKKATDGITNPIVSKKDNLNETTVSVFIPVLENQSSDMTVDQTVTVTINGKVTQIRRGEYVDVKVPVFIQLKNQFPNI